MGSQSSGAMVQQRTQPRESQGRIHPGWAVFSARAARRGMVRAWPLELGVKRPSSLLAMPPFANWMS